MEGKRNEKNLGIDVDIYLKPQQNWLSYTKAKCKHGP